MLWRVWYVCRSPVPCYVTGWYLVFDVATLTDILVTWPDMYTLVLAMLYLSLDIWHRYLPCYTYYLISDTGTSHAMLITWYLIPILAMLDLSLDIWHRYLPCLSLDIWYRYLPCYTYYLISDISTYHATLIAWYLTPDTWYNNTWHLTCYHPVLVHLTWYYGTCIILHIHDYYFYRDLA